MQRSYGGRRCGGLSRRHRPATQRAQARRPAQVHEHHAQARLHAGRSSLWDWYKNIHNGVADRRNVTIILMNEERQPVMRWHAENAWINKIEGPSFKASGNEVADRIGRVGARRPDHRSVASGSHDAIAASTPGVYYERVDASAPAISPLRTDIAGFVGIATRGPLHQPLPVQSWRQFQAYFGDFTGAGYLAYAVRAFFENGGQRCWVVRVASETCGDRGADAAVGESHRSSGRFQHRVPECGATNSIS